MVSIIAILLIDCRRYEWFFLWSSGYTAPEYAIHGQLSEKVDTYGFGVVVLEIISGRKSNDTTLDPSSQYLLEWVNFFHNLSFEDYPFINSKVEAKFNQHKTVGYLNKYGRKH